MKNEKTVHNPVEKKVAEPNHTSDSASPNKPSTKENFLSASRRGFLRTAGISAAVLAAGSMIPEFVQEAEAIEIGPPSQNPGLRAAQSGHVRRTTVVIESDAIRDAFPHPTNGDEEAYANQAFAGNFSKTLHHDPSTGLVVPSDYQELVNALRAGTQEAFQNVPAGTLPGRELRKLAGPLSPLAFQLQGADSTVGAEQFIPPSISSAAAAANYVELYWQAYLRDVHFKDYESNPLVAQAVADMNSLGTSYSGPKPVTPQNLFRYPFFGTTVGPLVSQLLYRTHFFDGVEFIPRIRTRLPVADPNTGAVLPITTSRGIDFMTNLDEYVFVENGNGAFDGTDVFDPTPRFVRSGRDLGSLANADSLYSIYFRAAIILSSLGVGLDPNTPYVDKVGRINRINGFNTFSAAWLFSLIGCAHATEAQAFYQKWYVHRHLRPEAFGNLVDGIKTNRFGLSPSLHSTMLNSAVLPLIFQRNKELNIKRNRGSNGSFFLPMEQNDGSPNHPDSPAGHAFTAGVGVTLLKAVFNVGTPENPVDWPANAPPIEPNAEGDNAPPITQPPPRLTVLGELNKLAANIADGRDWLGIHTRVGGNMLGLTLGEDVAIRLLNDLGYTYPESSFPGFTLTKFDGTTITVGEKQEPHPDLGGCP
jgi:hypothetical protein